MNTKSVINKSLRALFLSAMVSGAGAYAAYAGAGHGAKASIGEAGAPEQVTKVVRIEVQDNYFDPEVLGVLPGDTVKFVIVNQGELLHEFNIGTPEMHAEHQKEMAMMMEHGMLTETGMAHSMDSMDHDMMEDDMDHDMAGKMGHGDGEMDHSGMESMSMKHDDPNSVLVAPGETKELIWTFAELQNLEFGCNIPGHYESGMVGKFSSDVSAN